MIDPARLLSAYDDQLRGDAELPSAVAVHRLGPLVCGRYVGGRGLVTYRSLVDRGSASVRSLVEDAVAHFAADPDLVTIEWKARGHDVAPGLAEALGDAGFVAGERETVMVGEAAALAVDVPAPAGVSLRRVTERVDVDALCAMEFEAFGEAPDGRMADQLWYRLGLGRDDLELWVAEDGDATIVGAGRLEPVAGTEFAGLWGGATLAAWRHRGVYRALTAARARSAVARGCRLIHSDSTESSRPILARRGLVAVTTTTPYRWDRVRS